MAATSVELEKKLKFESPSRRAEYLELIDRLLETAYLKAQGKYCRNSERVAWMRVIGQLITAGTGVLKDEDLEQLFERVEKLEQEFQRMR